MAIIRNCSSNIVLILLILFIHLHTHSAKHPKQNLNSTTCIQSELNALMEFKGSVIDDSNLLSSWRGRECCCWYGITCNNLTGFVQRLDLSQSFGHPLLSFSSLPFFFPSSSLGGEINSSLLNLEHLEYLDLSNNHFNALPIPAFLGSLKNLQFLNLYSAGFKGEIPQQLGNLSNLQRLFLGDFDDYENAGLFPVSSSSSYPLSSKSFDWITGLSSLKVFEFYGVNMNESVDWLDSVNKLSSLSSLLIAYCWLPGMSMSSNSHFNLKGLQSLDLSNNYLSGMIPRKIGNLKDLESLDLSKNRICGTIPQSLATINTLSYLNLSFNNLTGRIPSGNHFDTLYDPSVYEGNDGVCGKQRSCPDDLVTSNKHNGPVYGGDNNEFELSWFYVGIGTGFAIGFLAVMCPLYFNKSWKSAYFEFLENVYDRVWVAFAIKISQIQRKFN